MSTPIDEAPSKGPTNGASAMEAATENSGQPPEEALQEAQAETGAADSPYDSIEPEPEPEPEVEPEAGATDFRDQRIRVLEHALSEREETLQKYIRAHKKAQMEFDSFKMRMRANQDSHTEVARGKLVERMLDVYDNLQRSLEASRLADTVDDLRAGVELVARDFLQRLEELGLERFDPIGLPFDPNCMEAMGVVPVAEDERNGTVVMTL
ncbi:MAG: nucleotide exchange factor GrpE, partial [Myxococcota bacterium]|nr:nucleotide exchange factor GrpE [Myxococcota bacterium]